MTVTSCFAAWDLPSCCGPCRGSTRAAPRQSHCWRSFSKTTPRPSLESVEDTLAGDIGSGMKAKGAFDLGVWVYCAAEGLSRGWLTDARLRNETRAGWAEIAAAFKMEYPKTSYDVPLPALLRMVGRSAGGRRHCRPGAGATRDEDGAGLLPADVIVVGGGSHIALGGAQKRRNFRRRWAAGRNPKMVAARSKRETGTGANDPSGGRRRTGIAAAYRR